MYRDIIQVARPGRKIIVVNVATDIVIPPMIVFKNVVRVKGRKARAEAKARLKAHKKDQLDALNKSSEVASQDEVSEENKGNKASQKDMGEGSQATAGPSCSKVVKGKENQSTPAKDSKSLPEDRNKVPKFCIRILVQGTDKPDFRRLEKLVKAHNLAKQKAEAAQLNKDKKKTVALPKVAPSVKKVDKQLLSSSDEEENVPVPKGKGKGGVHKNSKGVK